MKKKEARPGKKEKEIKKIVEDQTFGVKNKNKSKQAEQLVRQIAGQERGGYEKLRGDIHEERRKKKAEEEEKKLLVDVFARTATRATSGAEETQKVCPLFKAGLCTKGRKCKLLHPGREKAGDKIDLFTDQREQLFGEEGRWDKTQLEEAVAYNEGKYVNPARTDKTCRFFLEAVEKRTYGWLWVCPNGLNCVFRHALPPDFVFPSTAPAEKPVEEDIADVIDREREKLDTQKLDKITEEQFLAWAAERNARLTREREERLREEKRKLGLKAKKDFTGRELFEHQREIFEDDAEAVDDYEREEGLDVDEEVFNEEELPDFD